MSNYTNLFKGAAQTTAYALHRPRYPKQLFDHILRVCHEGTRTTAPLPLAVDVATGSGQAVEGYAHAFTRVLGLDASDAQLSNAPRLPNVEWRQADAHVIPADSGSVDLVTVAQALHWFDRPRFYKEVMRVLRPHTGVFAAWMYDAGHINTQGSAEDQAYQHVLHGTLGTYWARARKIVDEHYRDMDPLEPHFEWTERVEMPLVQELSVDQLVGYVRSWSAYNDYVKANPQGPDPLGTLRQDVIAATGPEAKLTMTRTIVMLLGRGPLVQNKQ